MNNLVLESENQNKLKTIWERKNNPWIQEIGTEFIVRSGDFDRVCWLRRHFHRSHKNTVIRTQCLDQYYV